jgi:undecaprenyl diphosphate synthase
MIERARVAERTEAIPRHVAIVMDGSERWARTRRQSDPSGERAAASALRETAHAAARCGVEILTVHARSEAMVRAVARHELEALRQADVRVRGIGPTAPLAQATRSALDRATEATLGCRGLRLNLALNYGARAELCDAVKALAFDVQRGRLSEDAIDENVLASYLYTPSLPDPDLLIRTGSELRIADFLLYQCAYSELWATPTLWPNFGGREFAAALHAYASRQRRFGS